jgi:hypothetical protein
MAELILHAFERKVLRRIYGPKEEKVHWIPRLNSGIYSLYKYQNVVDDIKITRLGGRVTSLHGRIKDPKKCS